MSLKLVTMLTMGSVVASLISEELKRKFLKSSNPILSSQTLVTEERLGTSQVRI